MVFTKLLLENALPNRPCNCGAASELLLPKVARCIPVLSSRCMGKCAARVLKRSGFNPSARSKFWRLSGSDDRVAVTAVSNPLILGRWVTKVLKNGDKKMGKRVEGWVTTIF